MPGHTPPSRAGARAVLASGVLLGVAMWAVLLAERQHMIAANFEVYRVAAEAALGGESIYAVTPERFPTYSYLYPPITVVAFLPFALLDPGLGFALHTVLEVGVALALAAVAIRWTERFRPLSRLDRALIVVFVVGSVHAAPSLLYGQVNLRMALLVALGLFLLEWSRSDSAGSGGGVAGGALALAALLKVFPAAIGLWLLRLRAWRALAGALAVGVGGIAAGAALLGPATTRTFFLRVLPGRTEAEVFAGGLDATATYVTVQRPLSHLLPAADPVALSVLAAAVLAPPLGYVYTALETPRDRLLAAHATVLAVFLVVPSYPLYYVICFGTLVPAVYAIRHRRSRRLLVAGALLANVVVLGGTLEELGAAAPPAIGDPLVSLGLPALAVATPVLVGCLVMLLGCVSHRHHRGGAVDRDAVPTPGP